MPLLRLETPDDIPSDSAARRLERLRDQFLSAHRVDFDDEANLAARLPEDLSFFAFPEQQLLSYERHRESSELGHVFRIANGLHDHIDAVVVVGPESTWLGASALAEACCDPFHNELSRAARGSKPRVYFARSGMDNDHLQSLLNRLAGRGDWRYPAEQNWALIAIDGAESSPFGDAFAVNDAVTDHAEMTNESAPCFVLEQLINAIDSTPAAGTEIRSRLVTSIGKRGNPTSAWLNERGFDQTLWVPNGIDAAASLLSPPGLLPAAFLGFDCIQLLVGAAAMNENFREQPAADNLVLRWLAANQAVAPAESETGESNGGDSLNAPIHRTFRWWFSGTGALESWRSRLGFRRAGESDSLPPHCSPGSATPKIICNHLTVDSIRTDPLFQAGDADETAKRGERSLPEIIQMRFERFLRELDAAGVGQTITRLPLIDTHALGQWIQMMLLAEALQDDRDAVNMRNA